MSHGDTLPVYSDLFPSGSAVALGRLEPNAPARSEEPSAPLDLGSTSVTAITLRIPRATRSSEESSTDNNTEDSSNSTREYDYGKLDDRYFYCETYRCWPRRIPEDSPIICSKNMKDWRTILIIFFSIVAALLLFIIIFFPVYFTLPQCEGFECTTKEGQSDRKCLKENQRCDGVNQCPNNDDESGCFPRVISMPKYVIGYIGEPIDIDCQAVRGTKDMEWYMYNQTTDNVLVLWSHDNGMVAAGYLVNSYRAHYDLGVSSVMSAHADQTFGVRFDLRSTERHFKIIPIGEVSCPPETIFHEGDMIEFSVSVQYYGDHKPLVLWYLRTIRGAYERLTSDENISSVGDLNTITANMSMEARLSLNGTRIAIYIPTQLPISRDPPSHSLQQCERVIVVQYAARDIYFEQNNSDRFSPYASEGKFVTCYASGNPRPAVNWTSCYPDNYVHDPEHPQTLQIPFYVSNYMITCSCNATNVVNGVRYYSWRTFTFRPGLSAKASLEQGSIFTSLLMYSLCLIL